MSNGFFDTILVPLRHKLFWIPLYLYLLSFIIINYKKTAILVLVGIVLTILISDGMSSQLIKKSIKRTRPCHQAELKPISRVPCSSGYSFTSSHATNHFALGTYFFLLFSFFKHRWLFFLWAAIIGFAQIYVGVHYPGDVIAGSLLGLLIGGLTFFIYQKMIQILSSAEPIA